MKLFISYRRQDSAARSGRLFDALSSRYGRDSIFIDMETISPGMDFQDHVQKAVNNSDLVVVVIGPGWLDTRDRGAQMRRIDDPSDYIRMELKVALSEKKTIVPVLVGGAAMPKVSELPNEIRELSMSQAISISDSSWPADIEKLTSFIDRYQSSDSIGLGWLRKLFKGI